VEEINLTQQKKEIQELINLLHGLKLEINKLVVGQENSINFMIIAILCNGHVLLEGVPGVAKTTLIKAISDALGLDFSRIQFTPDLLPSDLIGTLIFNVKTQEFETKKGPLFANFILADEINRAPAKVQSALLEAMQERQVTIGSNTYALDKPFLVFATQNPLEQEGTYRLPEAQLDRFFCKLNITYPALEQEIKILDKQDHPKKIDQIINKKQLINAQHLTQKIYVDEKIKEYITHIVFATRTPEKYNLKSINPYINYGVSPRATIALHQACRAHALVNGRHFATPDDVKSVALPILRHRIMLSYQAEADNVSSDTIIQQILKTVSSP
jgi:MoxR-like ATPase